MNTLIILISLTLAYPVMAAESEYEKAHRVAEEHRQRMNMEKLIRLQQEQAARQKLKDPKPTKPR
jgi:hypothetical protein